MNINYFPNLHPPSLWFEMKNHCFQTTSALYTAKHMGEKKRENSCDEMTKNSKRTWSQLQLIRVHQKSGLQVSRPDPCTPPTQQIDQKELSSVETAALFRPSW